MMMFAIVGAIGSRCPGAGFLAELVLLLAVVVVVESGVVLALGMVVESGP